MLKFLKLAQLRLKSSISNESFRTQSGYFAALSLVGTLLSLLVVFTRRDGMGGDEAGYLNYSFATMVGDSPTSGKPPLFYFANYFFRHSLEDIFGRIAFVSPYFVYALLFSISLSFLAFAISRLTNSKIWQVFALLWLSPLAFYHSTHLMMETPLFILINFIVGICIFSSMDVNRPALSLRMVSLSFLVALAVMIKETTLPALILIFCGVVFTDRIHKKYFIYGIFLGILLRILINHFMGAADAQYLNSGLQLNSIRMQLENIPLYISEWIFFLVPIVSILGIGALILSSLSRKTKVKIGFLLILGLTMAGAIALSSKIIAGRYSFPVLWVVFLILFILSLWRWKKLFIPSALSMIIPITSFFTPDPSRFHLWPTLFRREVYSSGSTVFVGSPLFQWILTNGPSKEAHGRASVSGSRS